MGTKAKREEFSQRFFYDKHFNDEMPETRPESENFLNLWQNFKLVSSMSFTSAKEDFLIALQAFETEKERQVYFVTLEEELVHLEKQSAELINLAHKNKRELEEIDAHIKKVKC